jgi:hypothetical protein
LTDVDDDDDCLYGLIKYGTTGIASDIIDPVHNVVQLRREKNFIEEIPLFFIFYMPEGEDTWYVASQSFGSRSCSTAFNRALFDFFRERSNLILQVQKVMPIDGLEMEPRPVQKLTLIRRRVDSEEFPNQLGHLARELMVTMSISIDGRGALGLFSEIRDRLEGRADRALVYDGIEFDEAQATVKVGNSYRKVGLLGASNNAGVVDVSDQIERDDDDFPTFESIKNISLEICEEYLAEYRDQ